MANVFTKTIIARNDNDKLMQISRNYQFNHFVKMNYLNAFVVDASNENIRNLVVQKIKAIY